MSLVGERLGGDFVEEGGESLWQQRLDSGRVVPRGEVRVGNVLWRLVGWRKWSRSVKAKWSGMTVYLEDPSKTDQSFQFED